MSPTILFFGASSFAIPSLEVLHRAGFPIAGVITKPDEPAGRRQKLTPPPVKIAALKLGLDVYQPKYLKQPEIKEIPVADLFIIAAYGAIIPSDVLAIPSRGALNVHPSLLPRWRGPSPVQYTILHGDKEAGVTIMLLDERMDHGPILAHSEWHIANSRPVYPELHDTLATRGAELLVEIIPKYVRGEVIPVPQDDMKATYSKLLKKKDGRIDWNKPAEYLERMIRAFTPWPGSWTMWPSGEQIYRVRIERADIDPEEPAWGSPGHVWQSGSRLMIRTGKGSLAVEQLTLEGRKPVDAASFLRGYPQFSGATLI